MNPTPHLTPAYGRDYVSREKLLADFYAGKDFVMHTPERECYCAVRDFPEGQQIQFRYSKLTKTFLHNVSAPLSQAEPVND